MINKHEFKKISISEIKPYDRNARTHSTEQVKQIMDAIKEWGLTDIYLDLGTYVKSFYSVMLQPVGVKVAPMGDNHKRLHHKVNYNKICPKIIRAEHKK